MRSGTSPQRHCASTHPITEAIDVNSYYAGASEHHGLTPRDSNDSKRPDVIEEVSEPVSPESMPSSHQSPRTSVLTQLIRSSPPQGTERHSAEGTGDDNDDSGPVVTVNDRCTSKSNEQTTLLRKNSPYTSQTTHDYGATHDLEGQSSGRDGAYRKIAHVLNWPKENAPGLIRIATRSKTWNYKALWKHGFLQPASYIPPVVLGLLLNLLDALSYGQWIWYSPTLADSDTVRHDLISAGATHFRRSWARRHINLLR